VNSTIHPNRSLHRRKTWGSFSTAQGKPGCTALRTSSTHVEPSAYSSTISEDTPADIEAFEVALEVDNNDTVPQQQWETQSIDNPPSSKGSSLTVPPMMDGLTTAQSILTGAEWPILSGSGPTAQSGPSCAAAASSGGGGAAAEGCAATATDSSCNAPSRLRLRRSQAPLTICDDSRAGVVTASPAATLSAPLATDPSAAEPLSATPPAAATPAVVPSASASTADPLAAPASASAPRAVTSPAAELLAAAVPAEAQTAPSTQGLPGAAPLAIAPSSEAPQSDARGSDACDELGSERSDFLTAYDYA
jgi:hypothetical protein